MKTTMNRFMHKFLQMLSEIVEARLQQLSKDAQPLVARTPVDKYSRIAVCSPELKRSMRVYYGGQDVRIRLALPAVRSKDSLLTYSKVEAYNADGEPVGPTIPLAVLSEEAVEALHVEITRILVQRLKAPKAATTPA
jgi:hypothetical protein